VPAPSPSPPIQIPSRDCPEYKRKIEVLQPPSHYILMLDSSGSMSRNNRWEELMDGVRVFFNQNTGHSGDMKVSVIVYDNIADIVIEFEEPS